MGQPKSLLPWQDTFVLGQVLSILTNSGIREIVVVTGGHRQSIEESIHRLHLVSHLHLVFNPDYAHSSMLTSLQVGIRALPQTVSAILVALGDQPQVRSETVHSLVTTQLEAGASLVVPSHQGRRGHPWLVARSYWQEILALPQGATARQFLDARSSEILYIPCDASILFDIDTPEDYQIHRP